MSNLMRKQKKLFIVPTVGLICALGISAFSPALTAQAADYGDKLDLSNTFELGKKKTYTGTGIYKGGFGLYKKAVKGKVKYTISSSRKEDGDNYVVTYKVKFKWKKNPKIQATKVKAKYDDENPWEAITMATMFGSVFDYETGATLEGNKNALAKKLGVKVKVINSKIRFYPKQKFTVTCPSDGYTYKTWIRNFKSYSCTFKVTYPKS